MESLKRVRSDSDDFEFDSHEAKRIQHDLLDTLEDTDEVTVGQDLDSFIKSFEDEISSKPSSSSVDIAHDTYESESKPNLEFLLEASDDELGLPPTESERVPDSTESGELDELPWLDDQVPPSYDSLEYGFDYSDLNHSDEKCNGEYEYVELDGLFPESLPAQ